MNDIPPLIPLPKDTDARPPYPLSRDEQELLFSELPKHLLNMALFKVNSGCREQGVCGLRWDWEVRVSDQDTSVFMIPSPQVKNGEERIVVLNRAAASVIKRQRGLHAEYVFPYRGHRVTLMYNSAWKRASSKAAGKYQKVLGKACPDGFLHIRIHDLKHTFGRRLRAEDVSFEDRQDLLGHKSGRITTHYSAAELHNLIGHNTPINRPDIRKQSCPCHRQHNVLKNGRRPYTGTLIRGRISGYFFCQQFVHAETIVLGEAYYVSDRHIQVGDLVRR
jgi:integrase